MKRARITLFIVASLLLLAPHPARQARAGAVIEWNVIALNATAIPPNSILQSRVLAIVHGAVHDAIRAVNPAGAAYAVDTTAPAGASVDAAVAGAGHRALVLLTPSQLPMLDAALNASLSKIPAGQRRTDGLRIGSQIGEQLVARPVTAIRAAADLRIPGLKGNPGWELLLVTPPQPDYPSAHAIFSGAAEAVLRSFFGSDEVDVSVTFPAPFGLTRRYRRFSEITEEVENARVWGGIHFRSADRDGSEVGRRIGAVVVRDFPQPAAISADTRPLQQH